VIVLLGWGALLLLGAVLQLFLGGDPVELALQGGVGAAAVTVGATWAAARGRGASPQAAHVADRSLPTALAAVGVGLMAFGAEAGPWLVAIGAGTTALALGGLVAEHRRQARR
jgi:hypothetical protein